jgi:hypothetical protein
MKKLILLLTFISSFAFGQDYDYQQLCLDCAEANGFYCGDDPANWTQYAPLGCVQTSWINDGWIDCIDEGDENGAVPTSPMDCIPPPPDCDTVYVDVPFYIYETIFQIDTIYNTEYITQILIDTVEVETFVPEYIYITDTVTVYEDVLDTLFVDVIEYVDVFIFDTIVQIETEYIEFFTTDTIIEYVDVISTEYIDCDTGLPCSSNIPDIINQSKNNGLMYNLLGQAIRQPEGVYIQNGQVKYRLD